MPTPPARNYWPMVQQLQERAVFADPNAIVLDAQNGLLCREEMFWGNSDPAQCTPIAKYFDWLQRK